MFCTTDISVLTSIKNRHRKLISAGKPRWYSNRRISFIQSTGFHTPHIPQWIPWDRIIWISEWHNNIILAIEDLELLANEWIIETLSVKTIRESKVDWIHPKYLIDWLLDSDAHIILCQGINCGMWGVWKPVDCMKEIQRLEYHLGFPAGINLRWWWYC